MPPVLKTSPASPRELIYSSHPNLMVLEPSIFTPVGMITASVPAERHKNKLTSPLPCEQIHTHHQIHPLPLLRLGHPRIPLGGNVIEGLLEKVKVPAEDWCTRELYSSSTENRRHTKILHSHSLSLLLSHEEVALLEARRDGGDAPRVLAGDIVGHGGGAVDSEGGSGLFCCWRLIFWQESSPGLL